jgi:hypothetical protein
MRMPTIKTLSAIPDADHACMRAILKMSRAQLLQIPVCEARDRECYHPPKTWYLRMTALNEAARTHGVESCQVEDTIGMHADDYAAYLNTGDSYVPTLIYWRGAYRVQSLGDFVETMERQGVKFK